MYNADLDGNVTLTRKRTEILGGKSYPIVGDYTVRLDREPIGRVTRGRQLWFATDYGSGETHQFHSRANAVAWICKRAKATSD